MKKLVKESLYEKFTEGGDPIEDMGIGMAAKIKKAMDTYYKYKYFNELDATFKDVNRIRDIVEKAPEDKEKQIKLATTMKKLIGDPEKMYRRYQAAKKQGLDYIADVFLLGWAEIMDVDNIIANTAVYTGQRGYKPGRRSVREKF